MDDLYEKMKGNRVPLNLLTKEEKQCLENASKVEYYIGCKEWIARADGPLPKSNGTVYRVAGPRKSHLIKCEVVVKDHRLAYKKNGCWYPLVRALNDTDFAFFVFRDGICFTTIRKSTPGNKAAKYPKYVVFVESKTE